MVELINNNEEEKKDLLIINSKYIDKEFVNNAILKNIKNKYYSRDYKPTEEELKNINESLEECYELEIRKLYRTMNAKKAFELYGEKVVIKMMMKMDGYSEKFSNIEIEMDVTEEELDRFIKYSYDREEDMKPCDDEMTTRKFLKLCRLCYDVAPEYPFPKDVSDFYVYSHMKGGNLDHEYTHALSEKVDIDSANDFVEYHHIGYHTEELKFGGPCIWFSHYNNPFKGKILWTAHFYGKGEKEWRTIKMYLALRDKGYPVSISEPEKVIRGYLMSSKIYSRDSWYGHKHYVKSAEEALKLAKKLTEKGE